MFFGYIHLKYLVFIIVFTLIASLTSKTIAQVNGNDTVQVIKTTPLKDGARTLAVLASGTVLKVEKLHGQFALVTITPNGQQITGWVIAKDLIVVSPQQDPTQHKQPPKAVPMTTPAMPRSITSFAPEAILPQIRKASKAGKMPESAVKKMPNGWSICPVDPKGLVDAYGTLSLKSGMTLKAYQFHQNHNGNGVVWAIPVNADFPDPNRIGGNAASLSSPPRPTEAYDNFMDAIQGNYSALSFLEASLLNRDLQELGAMWHGIDWNAHTVIVENSWESRRISLPPIDEWKWRETKPITWAPSVSVEEGIVTVIFYTYCPMYEKTIYRHVDKYQPGGYRFTTQKIKIATAGFGPIF